jgi:hypothetical protein
MHIFLRRSIYIAFRRFLWMEVLQRVSVILHGTFGFLLAMLILGLGISEIGGPSGNNYAGSAELC